MLSCHNFSVTYFYWAFTYLMWYFIRYYDKFYAHHAERKSLCSNCQASIGASGTLDVVGAQLYELSNLEVSFQSYVNAGDVAM